MKYLHTILGIFMISCLLSNATAQFNFNLYSGWNANIPLNLVADIDVSDNGTVWTVCPDRIVSFDGISWQVYDNSNSIIPMSLLNKLLTLGTDLWIGTHGQGVYKMDNSGSVVFFNAGNSGLLNDTILDIKKNSLGELIIKTREYLMQFDGANLWTNVDLTAVGPSNQIAVDANDDIWLTQQYGPAQFTNGSWIIHDTIGACPNNSSGFISASSSGVYFGNYEGFSKYSNNSWNTITGHGAGGMTAMHADQFGNLWVGDNDFGLPEIAYLYRYDGSTWIHCTAQTNPFEPEYYIKDIQMSTGGILWIGHARDLVELTNPLLNICDEKRKSNIKVYPNPMNEYIYIEIEKLNSNNIQLKLMNMQGQTVRIIDDIKSEQIKLERKDLVSGIYFLQLLNNKQIVRVNKLVVK